ncbi:DUF4166 domain-containing protein [Streptomyces sp. AC495_CC817]|uniref:DUF4166 domain-containing protein n=1 Tax=Streptomyces sp. AC495_CC817 TaxID=2823900 RepID=UPI001C25AB90|nr:DUF4166 domain-containing protein [Streptomyces sp. AC495_CC817]
MSASVEVASGEAFLRALGDDAALLHPQIAAQLRTPASLARGDGVFTRAGSRYRLLNLLIVPLLGREAIVTRFAADVPFSLRTESALWTVSAGATASAGAGGADAPGGSASPDGSGSPEGSAESTTERATLRTMREFHFPGGVQRVSDLLTTSTYPGLVRVQLGVRRRIELIEECTVGDGGTLRIRTRRAALHLGGRRFALRGVLAVRADVEDGWDEVNERRTIVATVRNPLFGTLLEYRGWYRHTPVAGPDGDAQ